MISVILFVVIAGFQAGLAMGQPWGEAAYGGANREISQQFRRVSAVATVIWLLAAVFVIRTAQEEGLLFLSAGAMRIVCWLVAAFLAVSVLMNGMSRSKLERNIWVPVSTVALVSTVIVLLLTD